jgi:hypothetical protein
MTTTLTKIVTNCKPGACQEALIAARRYGLETGGWCLPFFRQGEWHDTWLVPYGVKEIETHKDASWSAKKEVTRRTVRDSDATLWIGPMHASGALVVRTYVHDYRRLSYLCPIERPISDKSAKIAEWINKHQIEVLNVCATGNMARTHIEFTRRLVVHLLRRLGFTSRYEYFDIGSPRHSRKNCWCSQFDGAPDLKIPGIPNKQTHLCQVFSTVDLDEFLLLKKMGAFGSTHSRKSIRDRVSRSEVLEWPLRPFLRYWGVIDKFRAIQAIRWLDQ